MQMDPWRPAAAGQDTCLNHPGIPRIARTDYNTPFPHENKRMVKLTVLYYVSLNNTLSLQLRIESQYF